MIVTQIIIEGVIVTMIMAVIWWAISGIYNVFYGNRLDWKVEEYIYTPTLPDQTYDQIIAAQEVYELIAAKPETPSRPEEAPPERR